MLHFKWPGRLLWSFFVESSKWGVFMKRKLFGNMAVSLIVCTLGAIAGVAMMVLAGSTIKEGQK